MGTSNVLIKYRPVRVGWLIRKGSFDELLSAVRASTVLWGGIYNVVIAVESDTDLVKRRIRQAAVDVVIPLSDDEKVLAVAGEHSYLQPPRYYSEINSGWSIDNRTKQRRAVFLDIAPMLYRIWLDLRNAKDAKPAILLPIVDPDDSLSAALTVQFGSLPEDGTCVTAYQRLLRSHVQAEKLSITNGGNLDARLEAWATPIKVSGYMLSGIGRNPFAGIELFVGDHASFDHLVEFWNLRASGIRVEFISSKAIDRYAKLLQSIGDRYKARPGATGTTLPTIALYGNCSNEERDRLRELIGADFPTANVPRDYCEAIAFSPLLNYIVRDEAIAHFDEPPADRSTTTIVLPNQSFIADGIEGRDPRQLVAVDVDSGIGRLTNGTLNPPHLPALDEIYGREIALNSRAVRSRSNGISVITTAGQRTLLLRPITYWRIAEGLFSLSGIKVKRSVAGMMTDKVIEKFGGLGGTQVFKIRGVRRLLEELSPTEAVTLGTATSRLFNDGQFSQHSDIFFRGQPSTTSGVFAHLLEHDVFRAGLTLVCEQCQLDSWLPLPRISDFWECEFCGQANRTSLHLKDRGDWRFRRSGIFARGNSQEGAIPVVLALQTLREALGGGLEDFTYTTSVKLDGTGIDVEVDYIVFSRGDDDVLEVILGEAKSRGGAIQQEDLDNLLAARSKLEPLGVRCILSLAKTASAFSDEERERFANLWKDQVPLILLTNREMERMFPYAEEGPDSGDILHKYAVRTLDLIENSIARYLTRRA